MNDEVPHSDSNKSVTSASADDAVVPHTPHIPSEQLKSEVRQILSYVDASPNMITEFAALSDHTFSSDATPNDDLATFLSRPVKIHEIDWTEGVAYAETTIQPWHLFFNTAAIRRKIDNYAFLHCNLHLKVVVNASPFYYGSLLINYNPMPDVTMVPGVLPSIASALVAKSQRPHIWVYPQNNQGGELILPFFFPRNWMDITSASDLQDIGSLTLSEVNPLQHANGVAGGTISVQIYAWAENVELTGPTFALAIQGGKQKKMNKVEVVKTGSKNSENDEYTTGPVSRVASTVSNIASALTSVPVIGQFAKATQMGADAVHGIASMFGFTKVPVISDTMPIKNLPFSAFANTEVGVPVQKLTLDPKNELTLDPRTVGLSGGDEMSLCYINCRESYLKSSVWSVTHTVGTILMQVPINPTIIHSAVAASDSNGFVYNTVPMGLVAQHFRLWRGNIVVRIKAICTQYHKGRLRVSWDPIYTPGFGDDNTVTAFNKIVDLTPDLDIEFEIDFLQSRHWLETLPVTSGAIPRVTGDLLITPGKTLSTNQYNGMLSVQVLNDLSGPTTSNISLLLFVRGTPSLEFCDPYMHADESWSYFQVQSGNMVSCDGAMAASHSVDSEEPEKDSYTVYAGEVVRSIRPLLHRTNITSPITFSNVGPTANSVLDYVAFNQSAYPDPVGYNPNGMYSALGRVSGVREDYDWGVQAPFLWFVPCFAGMRGSMHWHFNVRRNASLNAGLIEACRTKQGYFQFAGKSVKTAANVYTASLDPGYYAAARSNMTNTLGHSAHGLEIMNPQTQGGFSVSAPFYANTRFYGTNPVNWNVGVAADDSADKPIVCNVQSSSISSTRPLTDVVVDRYYETGPDFNLFFFIGVPAIHVYGNAPSWVPNA